MVFVGRNSMPPEGALIQIQNGLFNQFVFQPLKSFLRIVERLVENRIPRVSERVDFKRSKKYSTSQHSILKTILGLSSSSQTMIFL